MSYQEQGYYDDAAAMGVKEESQGMSTTTIIVIVVVLGLLLLSIIGGVIASVYWGGDKKPTSEEEEAKVLAEEEEAAARAQAEEAAARAQAEEVAAEEKTQAETAGGVVPPPEEPVTGAEEEIESKPAPIVCTQDCENGGTAVAGADGKCVCKCVGEWMGPKCAAPVPNTKTFNQVATNCKDKAGYFWNGYDCVKASAGPCGCKTEAGFGEPKCVCANGGTTGFCYAKVGGQRSDWVKGTDAKCCAAAAHGSTKVGDPAPWGGAGCVWSGTLADCEKRLAQMGC